MNIARPQSARRSNINGPLLGVDQCHETRICFGIAHDAFDKPFRELFHAALLREEGCDFIKLRQMTILFLDRSRLFGHFLLKVVVEVFKSIRHAVEALSNAPDFVFASRRHARRQISAGESVDAFAEFVDGTNHPAPEEKHNRKETADRQHNQEHLQIAKLPQIPASPLFNAVRKIRCFIQKTAECILVNRLPKLSRTHKHGFDTAAPAPFKEVELVGNIGLSRQQERLPAVAAANVLKAVEHRLKFFVEIEPRRARLRKIRCSISMKAQFAHCVFGRCACLKLPVNKHRPGNRPGNKAHPKKRENEKTSRKAFKVLQDEHEALRRALRLGGNCRLAQTAD